jgi:hypothetical protein
LAPSDDPTVQFLVSIMYDLKTNMRICLLSEYDYIHSMHNVARVCEHMLILKHTHTLSCIYHKNTSKYLFKYIFCLSNSYEHTHELNSKCRYTF